MDVVEVEAKSNGSNTKELKNDELIAMHGITNCTHTEEITHI